MISKKTQFFYLNLGSLKISTQILLKYPIISFKIQFLERITMPGEGTSNIRNDEYWELPDNPFDYVGIVSKPGGIGTIPNEKKGTRIAIIGAGCSGLCAAYELMKIGLHPVVYESVKNPDGTSRIGGRAYTYRFPGDPRAYAELGAMRIPSIFRTTTFYMDQFAIDYSQPFPDPLLVPTVLYFNGKKYFIPVGGNLPPEIKRAETAWKNLISPLIGRISQVWDQPGQRSEVWQEYVERFANRSFYDVLRGEGLSRQEIQLFGSLGLGTGGFNSLYQVSFLEILRLVTCKWEVDQRCVKGGVDQIPKGFWTKILDSPHWGQTSVEKLNNGQPLPAVKEIYTPKDPKSQVVVTDADGNTSKYDALLVSCSPRALEMDIKINRETFSEEQWTALHNLHIINSGKVFVRTKTAFWKNQAPASTLQCTITDEATRATYLFDFDNTQSGVICLSYTWEDSAVKFNALNHEERVQTSIRILERIYGKDLISHQVEESISFFWEQARGYNGAFKLTYPGQYEHQKVLFLQPFSPAPERHTGVFLAGDAISWAGGWVEGALHAGLNAAMAVVYRVEGNVEVPGSGAGIFWGSK